MARIFKVNETTEILCEFVSTRSGFRHDARLFKNGNEYEKAKVCYVNRTWEKFDFETVIHKLLEKTDALTETEKEQFRTELNNKYGY
jgi:hypothetical protein